MLIPIRTDAPIYFFPFVTIGLIAVNVIVFLVGAGDKKFFEEYALLYGKGLIPHQWVTSNFLHAGLMHLIGNMIFLWTFGLIIEGKIGPWQFGFLYLSIGVIECGIEQAIMSSSVGGSVGASAIIYGLFMIAMMWAPYNELQMWGFIGFRMVDFEMPNWGFALFYVAWEIMLVVIFKADAMSAILHLGGAVVGGLAGYLYLAFKAVDCEGWDLLSIMKGNEPWSTRGIR